MGYKHVVMNMIANITNGEKWKLTVDIERLDNRQSYYQREHMTRTPESVLKLNGYVPAYKFKDSLKYFGIPVYMKLKNWEEYAITAEDPQDTAYTLNDFRKSNTAERFKRALSRLVKVNQMDIKVVGLIIVAVAIAGVCIFIFMG